MKPPEDFDQDYISLILNINKHIDGYIDAYIGPAHLKEEIDAQPPRSPSLLQNDVARLQDNIPKGSKARHVFLKAMLRAIETTLQMLAGEDIPFMEEVQRLYDIMPQRTGEEIFLEAHNKLDTYLPGSGSLPGRLETWRNQYNMQREKLLPTLLLVQSETKKRTLALIDLPAGESVEVELVNNQPWSAYNWFKGNGHSQIEFNTDIPKSALALLPIFAHEGYPGHHSEAAIKEQKFWRGLGYGEAAGMLLHAPTAVISEGIAMTAVEIIFPQREHIDWTVDILLPTIPMAVQDSAEFLWNVQEAMLQLRWVSGNAAILFHTEQQSREQTIEYIQTYGLSSVERAEQSFSFITHPLYRSYVFTYTQGYELISKAAGAKDKTEVFISCLTEQKLPSQLAAQGARVAHGS